MVVTCVAALALIGLGGLVTSHGVGMAVPDWPNTFGYNMFFFPFSKWVGGVFYEHSHRLAASAVGLLTSVLALWLYGRSARPSMRWLGAALLILGAGTRLAAPGRWSDALVLVGTGGALLGASFIWPRCEPSPKWLRRLGLAAFLAVVLQGVLGGLRVVLFKDQIGIFHAALAQLFFVLLCAMAFLTGKTGWEVTGTQSGSAGVPSAVPRPSVPIGQMRGLTYLLLGATCLIFAQLILGATMRHQHAGLAIPDFPGAYGRIWPATDPTSIAHYNQQRIEVVSLNPITATQVILQMVHRLLAGVIFGVVAACTWTAWLTLGARHALSRLTQLWLGLILIQVLLGAATIWSDKAADVATAHVLVGALLLAIGVISSIMSTHDMILANRVAYGRVGVSPTLGAAAVSAANVLRGEPAGKTQTS